MRVRIAPKSVIRVSTILVLSVSLVNGLPFARSVDDQILSPQLADLQDGLRSGDRKALDSFWNEIEQHRAPTSTLMPADPAVTSVGKSAAKFRTGAIFLIANAR